MIDDADRLDVGCLQRSGTSTPGIDVSQSAAIGGNRAAVGGNRAAITPRSGRRPHGRPRGRSGPPSPPNRRRRLGGGRSIGEHAAFPRRKPESADGGRSGRRTGE
nr:hypothetical protein E2R29_15315 [Burkholderia pseudomallei]